ncbi:sensor histidine kinase [Pedobacter foliorum]|uniref:sensor histidine kinase n=1 Tax=Pedobacter foliorum TaxID=2739058 RepID=UPI001566533D|nr:histidine kinase [Pedobacter foliorum]NRF37393.1 histidine kinase [Pedobacter foliorum]
MGQLRKHWKQILTILVIYTVWCVIAFLSLVALQGLQTTLSQLGTGSKLYINFVHSVIKDTLVYYILIYHLVKPMVEKGGWKKPLLKCILLFAVLTGYEYLYTFHIIGAEPRAGSNLTVRTFIISAICLDIAMLLISIFSATLINANEMQKRKEGLEKQKLKAELAAIKYQINPHFLFNSLSFIYTKTVLTSPEAAKAVYLLSEIMSYALDEWDDLGTVPLSLEAEQVKRVIEMNQIRFSHQLNICYVEHIEDNIARVPILSLVTLVENAFKHGDMNDAKNQMTIELQATRSRIYFRVSNKKKKGPKEPSKGIGLSNVQQRLELMYGIKHVFNVKEDENFYMNEITINL